MNTLKVRAIKSLINQGYTYVPGTVPLTADEQNAVNRYMRKQPEFIISYILKFERAGVNASKLFNMIGVRRNGNKGQRIRKAKTLNEAMNIYRERRTRRSAMNLN